MTLAIDYRPLADVVRHEANPKDHDLPLIIDSIRRFGFLDPVVIDQRTGIMAAGHGRVEALTILEQWVKAGEIDQQGRPYEVPAGVDVDDAGGWRVPTVVGWESADDLEAEAVLVALNQTTVEGGWDDEALLALLERLAAAEVAFDGIGFDEHDLSDLRVILSDLDDLDTIADGYEHPDDEPGEAVLRLLLNREVLDAWKAHAVGYDGDSAALAALLAAAE